MTMAEVQEDRVATIKYKRDRVSEDEQEIAELEAERNKDVEAQREEEAEQELGAEEQTYKKRYGDLRRHTQKIQDENKRQLQKLQDQVEALTKKQVKLPKSDE